jgi:hypothetical protein
MQWYVMLIPHCRRFNPVVAALPSLIPDGFIYLKADPDTCLSRLKLRSRTEEAAVSLEYLEDLHSKHEEWLINGAHWGDRPAKVCICWGVQFPPLPLPVFLKFFFWRGKVRFSAGFHAADGSAAP